VHVVIPQSGGNPPAVEVDIASTNRTDLRYETVDNPEVYGAIAEAEVANRDAVTLSG
jgi:hypothetical protein